MLAAGLMGLGTVLQTVSEVQAANSRAKGARAEAKSIERQAAFTELQSRRQSAMAIGKMVATGAASGVDITSGSPLFMELDSVRQAELEALNIRHQGAQGAAAKRFEARMAKASRTGIIIGGATKLAGVAAMSSGGGGAGGGWNNPSGGMASGAGSFGARGGSVLGGWWRR